VLTLSVWVNARQIRPAFAVIPVVMTEDRCVRSVSDHVCVNLQPPIDQ
jgi:hypothetical protein